MPLLPNVAGWVIWNEDLKHFYEGRDPEGEIR